MGRGVGVNKMTFKSFLTLRFYDPNTERYSLYCLSVDVDNFNNYYYFENHFLAFISYTKV